MEPVPNRAPTLDGIEWSPRPKHETAGYLKRKDAKAAKIMNQNRDPKTGETKVRWDGKKYAYQSKAKRATEKQVMLDHTADYEWHNPLKASNYYDWLGRSDKPGEYFKGKSKGKK